MEAPAEMYEWADILCPLWGQMLRQGEEFRAFYQRQREAGKRLELYIIATVLSDPYAAYRLPAWWAFDMDAGAINFWAFGSNGAGEGDSWNQYAAQYTSYAPAFLAPGSVTAGKQMESIREGIQDFEYLVMLRERIKQLTAAGAPHPLLPRARALLEGAARRVIEAEGAGEIGWKDPKDRSVADTVRIEIGEILEDLR